MRWYPTQIQITQTVASSMSSLSSLTDADAVRVLMESNVVSALVNAVDKHKRHVPIASHGLCALGNMLLTAGSTAVAAALKSHAFQLVAEVMDAHPSNPS